MGSNIAQIQPVDVPAVWAELAERLPPHLDKMDGRLRVEDVFRLLVDGEWALWVIHDDTGQPEAFVGLSVKDEPSGAKSGVIEFMVGEHRKEWLPSIPLLENWARGVGCDRLQMLVPKVFARDLPDYRMSHVFLERAL